MLLPFYLAIIVAGVAWVGAAVSAVQVVTSMSNREGVDFWGAKWNPFNVIFFPDALTDRGLEARRRLISYVLLFVAAVVCGIGYRFVVAIVVGV